MSGLPSRVVLIAGPPCSGKTTAATRWSSSADVVLDFDVIARELGSPALWLHPEPWRSQADSRMRQAVAALPGTGPGVAFVIRSAAAATYRARLARSLGVEACVVLDPGVDVCIDRAERAHRPPGTVEQIRAWYRVFRPWAGDVSTFPSHEVAPPVSRERAVRFNPSREW